MNPYQPVASIPSRALILAGTVLCVIAALLGLAVFL